MFLVSYVDDAPQLTTMQKSANMFKSRHASQLLTQAPPVSENPVAVNGSFNQQPPNMTNSPHRYGTNSISQTQRTLSTAHSPLEYNHTSANLNSNVAHQDAPPTVTPPSPNLVLDNLPNPHPRNQESPPLPPVSLHFLGQLIQSVVSTELQRRFPSLVSAQA